MESSVSFFGQIKYILKGIIKPRFFNRLSAQSKGCMIAYMIIMTILSTVVYWGVNYLVTFTGSGFSEDLKQIASGLPEFEYSNGTLTVDGSYASEIEEGKLSIVVDTSVPNMTPEFRNKAEIKSDWLNGKTVYIFNGKDCSCITSIGQMITTDYTDILAITGISSSFNKGSFAREIDRVILRVYGILAVISLPFFLIKAVVTGFVFMGVGFGIIKIVKAQYSLTELYTISVYITGVTTILKRAIRGSGIGVGLVVVDIIFILIVAAYLFFALTGSAEESGPTSTIYFNKPSAKKPEIEEEDVFSKRNYASNEYQSGAYQKSESTTEFRPKTATVPVPSFSTSAYQTAAAETETAETVYSSETVAQQEQDFSASYAQTDNTYASASYETANTSFASQTTYADTTTTYETPVTPSYEQVQTTETQAVYSETVQEQTAPKPAIIKSEATYGFGMSTSTGKRKKPKYDRPITAPDSYNGSYYGSDEDDQTEESTYFGKSLLENRGGMYGKTLSAFTPSEPKSNVITQPENPFEGINLGAKAQNTSYGGSLYNNTESNSGTSSGVVFTTKSGAEPFAAQKRGYGSYDSFGSLGGSQSSATPVSSYTKKGSTKKINRYSADDFAAWEREAYAEEFNKPIGGFGNM